LQGSLSDALTYAGNLANIADLIDGDRICLFAATSAMQRALASYFGDIPSSASSTLRPKATSIGLF
jgi:hypothetical protein